MDGFGEALFFVLMDADSGYHHVRLAERSAQKTAFFTPGARKCVWSVMPFGLRNAPAVFTALMYDFK